MFEIDKKGSESFTFPGSEKTDSNKSSSVRETLQVEPALRVTIEHAKEHLAVSNRHCVIDRQNNSDE